MRHATHICTYKCVRSDNIRTRGKSKKKIVKNLGRSRKQVKEWELGRRQDSRFKARPTGLGICVVSWLISSLKLQFQSVSATSWCYLIDQIWTLCGIVYHFHLKSMHLWKHRWYTIHTVHIHTTLKRNQVPKCRFIFDSYQLGAEPHVVGYEAHKDSHCSLFL